MFRIKNFAIVMALSAFSLVLMSLWMEHQLMGDAFKRLDTTFDLALSTAISASMGSEEVFSEKVQAGVSSRAHKMGDDTSNVVTQTKIFSSGGWVQGNLHKMAMYYTDKGYFPTSQVMFNTYANHKTTSDVYKRLFGGVGSDYGHASLKWANRHDGVTIENPTGRSAVSCFKQFYDKAGRYVVTSTFCKERVGDRWVYTDKELPVLAQMGLKLSPYNEVTSDITNDNFSSSLHYGKNRTKYYLTPYSLGVTYLPLEVLKPTLLTHFDQIIRLSKCKINPLTDAGGVKRLAAYQDADGAIPSLIYELGETEPKSKRIGGGEWLLNDGLVEYDLNTLQVKVDYFPIDFYADKNYVIVNHIVGATPYDVGAMRTLPSRLQAVDTRGDTKSVRLVAKVTVKMKVFIPYRTPFLQEYVDRVSVKGVEHLGTKRWHPGVNQLENIDDGLWYQASQYVAITR